MSPARRRAAWTAAAFAAAVLCHPPAGQGATLPSGFDQQTLVSGLTRPTAVAWAPDGRMFIAEKDGVVRVADPGGALDPTPVIDISNEVATWGDRGLLGIAVDAAYTSNHFVYLLYTYKSDADNFTGPAVSKLRRVVINPDNSVGPQQVILGTYTPTAGDGWACPSASNTLDCIPSDSDTHSIGTVRADPDGSLWVGSGDGAGYGGVDQLAFRTYDEAGMVGKVMHIDRTGSGLPGHPFCASDSDLAHVCTKLYAKGFRNPFRFTLRSGGLGPAVGDVGWNTWEELDMLQAGGDYGWPCWEATHQTPDYSADPKCSGPEGEYTQTVRMPVFENPHPGMGGDAGAIVGGPTYSGTDFPAGYRGTTFAGDYSSGIVRRYDPSGGQTTVFSSGQGPWVDIESAPGGLSYAHTGDLVYVDIGDFSDGSGTVGRVYYGNGNHTPVARASGNATPGNPPVTVTFTGDTSSDPDGDPLGYAWDFGDGGTSTQANPVHQYASRGRYTARLAVSDGRGLSADAAVTITVGGPVATIANPADGSPYRDGVGVPLQGSAVDAGGDAVPDSGLSWQVILHHSASHIHDLGTYGGGNTNFVPLTDHDADSWYDLTLTATDSSGLQGSSTVTIRPETVSFTIASTPSGALVGYAGTSQTAPFAATSAVGFQTSVSAASQFTSAGTTYVFSSWSDGGAIGHNVTIPAASTTLTATYAPEGQRPTETAAPPDTGGSGSVAGAGTVPLIDRLGPNLRLGAIAADLRRGRLKGTAKDAGGVREVEVAVRARRRGGTPCRWWSWRRRALGAAHACAPPAWIRAKLTGSAWEAWLGRSLPLGSYVVLARAIDRRGKATTRITSVRLR